MSDKYFKQSNPFKVPTDDGKTVEISAGETFLAKKGARVKYTNPFDEPAEYWAVCLPAFALEKVHRED